MQATVRRGPFAAASTEECLEYLLSRKRQYRAPVEKYSVYHTIAYQRRVHAIKHNFFARAGSTPLGWALDWWAGALDAHHCRSTGVCCNANSACISLHTDRLSLCYLWNCALCSAAVPDAQRFSTKTLLSSICLAKSRNPVWCLAEKQRRCFECMSSSGKNLDFEQVSSHFEMAPLRMHIFSVFPSSFSL